MEMTYAEKKRPEAAERQAELEQQPSFDALRVGAAAPTPGQKGHRVDLPEAMRAKMETAFGADLSAVKLYESRAVADAGAKAITRGSDIAFAPGVMDFTSFGGQKILGHEISHVVSQARGEVTGSGFLNDAALEARADREGAMAAAGEQIAMPAASLSPVTAAPAAGPMQAWGKNKDKTPTPTVAGPAGKGINFGKGVERLKGNDYDSSSVVKVKENETGNDAVLKMGTNPILEKSLSKFHNTVGRAYDKFGSKYKLDSPDARPLTEAEKQAMRKKKLIGTKKGKLRSMIKGERKESEEIDSATVYSLAKGKSRTDKKDHELEPGEFNKNPEDYMDALEYQRALGFVAATDMATGNIDRVAGLLNLGNWTEDRENHQIHLIDNDYQEAGGLGRDVDTNMDRAAWMQSVMQKFGTGAREENLGMRFMNGIMTPEYGAHDPEELEQIFRRRAVGAAGVDQAVAALPGMRKDLEAQFRQESGDGSMDKYQTEMIERMHILDEFTHDKRLSEVYERLTQIGFKEYNDDSDAVKKERRALLAEIQANRAQKERQQQQQG